MRKAVSPMISAIILVVIGISVASFVGPWMYELVTTTTNSTGNDARSQVICRSAGLDFDSNYGYYGVTWNFAGNGNDTIKAKLVNSGTVDLYGFSFEVTLDSAGGEEIKHYSPTNTTEATSSDPLRSSQSKIIEADITEDINGSYYTFKSLKMLNTVCVGTTAYMDV